MAITTYEFYEKTYFGDVIPVESFEKFESRAVDELHLVTCGKMKGLEAYTDEAQKAVCALAEVLFQIDAESRNSGIDADGKGKVIKSMSSGSESISYDIQRSEYAIAVSDKKVRNMLCYEAIKKFLSGTEFLYWGI